LARDGGPDDGGRGAGEDNLGDASRTPHDAPAHGATKYWRDEAEFSSLSAILDIGEDINVPEDFTESELKSGLWWRHLVAGACAGAVSRTSTAPLDRLKVFLQVHGPSQFGTLVGCMKHMVKEGGVQSLWRGNGVNILKIAPESALKFMAYEQTKRAIRGETPREMRVHERFVAGSFAGAFSQSVIYPMEVLKTRLALRRTGEFRGMTDAAVKIYQREGIRSFYRGYVPNLLGIIPYAGIELTVYETLKSKFMRSSANGEPSVQVALICATTSSTCGQLCAYPLALIRTKLQAQAVHINIPSTASSASANAAAAATASAYPATMSGVTRHILAHEGWTGLYRGILPNFMKVIPAVSISFVVYEKARAALGVTMT
jgi:solute carrier family 25 phosphate transporter 23/24/25/41